GGGAALPGGAPPGGCWQPGAQSHEHRCGRRGAGGLHGGGAALPAGAGAPRADPGAGPSAVSPGVRGAGGPLSPAASGAGPAALVASAAAGRPGPASPGAGRAGPRGPLVGPPRRPPARGRWCVRGVTAEEGVLPGERPRAWRLQYPPEPPGWFSTTVVDRMLSWFYTTCREC